VIQGQLYSHVASEVPFLKEEGNHLRLLPFPCESSVPLISHILHGPICVDGQTVAVALKGIRVIIV
jgi:hypothetical protein